jgi:hypothetical protein
MGRFEIQSETAFDYDQEVVWDFATNPNNWVYGGFHLFYTQRGNLVGEERSSDMSLP